MNKENLKLLITENSRAKLAAKQCSSKEIQGIISSIAKNLQKVIDSAAGKPEYAANVAAAQKELDYISQFLPKTLSEDETRVFLWKIATENKMTEKRQAGHLMGFVKQNPVIDMKLAAKIAQEILK